MLKKLITSLVGLMFSIQLQAGNAKPDFYQVKDWITDGVFTNGVEGPAVDKNGILYAVNFTKQGTIGAIQTKNQAELFVELPNTSIGNGIRFDHKGHMYIADYVNHNVLFISRGSKQVSVYAHSEKMNQPNDLAIMDNGILFASDPNWSDNTGNVWKIGLDKTVTLIEANMGTTNGIEVSPDNNRLYVNESVQRKVWVYDLSANGEVSNKRLFTSFTDHGLDGMRTDNQGNLYIARYGAGVIAIFSPKGELIREVPLKGQHPTNLAFGGKNGNQVFVTMQKRGAIETFYSEIPGRNFK